MDKPFDESNPVQTEIEEPVVDNVVYISDYKYKKAMEDRHKTIARILEAADKLPF